MYCSLVSKQNGEDPIGTAGVHDRYVFVEVPLPWDRKVETSRHFPSPLNDVVARFKEEGKPCRILAFINEDHRSPNGMRRVMLYKRPDGPFSEYEKEEYVVKEELIGPLVETWLSEKAMDDYVAYEEKTGRTRDIFICTNGSRDVCCGKFGYSLYETIKKEYENELKNNFRVWRVSHIGGHRLAPTLIDMPEARYWGHVTDEVLDTLLLRQGDFEAIAKHYRGWSGIHKWAQVVERELFKQKGWEWTTYKKEAVVLKEDGDVATVRLTYESKNGNDRGTYEAEVDASKRVKTEGCTAEPKEVKQYEVKQLTKC